MTLKSSTLPTKLVHVCIFMVMLTRGCSSVAAFQVPVSSRSLVVPSISAPRLSSPSSLLTWNNQVKLARTTPSYTSKTKTILFMNYNLPPSGGGGGGGGGNKGPISELLGGALTIGAIVLFFVSPLGSIFFAITNSLFLLALITPVILFVAFQVWTSLNTIQGTCPNCGAPQQTVIKDPDQVSFCFNCGAFLKASNDLKTIELSAPQRGSGSFIDMDAPSASGGGGADFGSVMDQMFGGGGASNSSPSSVKEKEQKFRRDNTIIDVDFDKDDK